MRAPTGACRLSSPWQAGTGFNIIMECACRHLTVRWWQCRAFYMWKNYLPMRYWSPDSAAYHRQALP